jgi:hypothetical protein
LRIALDPRDLVRKVIISRRIEPLLAHRIRLEIPQYFSGELPQTPRQWRVRRIGQPPQGIEQFDPIASELLGERGHLLLSWRLQAPDRYLILVRQKSHQARLSVSRDNFSAT